MADISEVTRRDIIDRIWDWSGPLQEDQFLSRLYDLSALPSDDTRFKNAAGDRLATFRDAALCAEATLSVIRIAAIISERRELGD